MNFQSRTPGSIPKVCTKHTPETPCPRQKTCWFQHPTFGECADSQKAGEEKTVSDASGGSVSASNSELNGYVKSDGAENPFTQGGSAGGGVVEFASAGSGGSAGGLKPDPTKAKMCRTCQVSINHDCKESHILPPWARKSFVDAVVGTFASISLNGLLATALNTDYREWKGGVFKFATPIGHLGVSVSMPVKEVMVIAFTKKHATPLRKE